MEVKYIKPSHKRHLKYQICIADQIIHFQSTQIDPYIRHKDRTLRDLYLKSNLHRVDMLDPMNRNTIEYFICWLYDNPKKGFLAYVKQFNLIAPDGTFQL